MREDSVDHTNALHCLVGVAKLLAKLIVGTDEATHDALVVAQEKKGLATGRWIRSS